MAKIEMKSWEELMLEEVRAFDVAIADDDVVIFESESYDELIVEKDERDLHRWELDPASAEDYREHAASGAAVRRNAGGTSGTSRHGRQRWLAQPPPR